MNLPPRSQYVNEIHLADPEADILLEGQKHTYGNINCVKRQDEAGSGGKLCR
jgi:hypothetical protein